MDDVIALLLGSFILALAVEHYNIHRRLALNVSFSSYYVSLLRWITLMVIYAMIIMLNGYLSTKRADT
ncbi:hypothetical protein ACFX2J_005338 [Malus domestica]